MPRTQPWTAVTYFSTALALTFSAATMPPINARNQQTAEIQ
jgi:hypothetical protein